MNLQIIKDLGNKLGLDFQDKENGIYQLWHCNGFAFIEFKHVYTYLNTYYADDFDIEDDINQNEYFLSFKILFRDWHVSNDRTDFNDITSSTIATILRLISKNSFRLIDIQHPMSFMIDIFEIELYGRELVPTQNINIGIDLTDSETLLKTEELLIDFIMVINMLFGLFNCSNEICDEYDFEGEELKNWVNKISTDADDNHTIYNSRTNPKWFYYKKNNLSIVKNESICQWLFSLYKENADIQSIDGVNGNLLVENNIKNFINKSYYLEVEEILKNIEDNDRNFLCIPLDNLLTCVGDEHLVFLKGDFDFDEYIKEKEIVRQRHVKESILLFKENLPQVTISTKEDTKIFENLILELLKRESYIFWAKKVAPTNEADNGRDIICKFNLKHKNQSFSENEIELDYKKMIVQCKTNLTSSKKQSIGKSDVNIIDTIYDYNPDGYILVTNTQITTRLTEHLERIEEKEKIYIDWWNKEDIEERLLKYPDLVHKYSSIIQIEI